MKYIFIVTARSGSKGIPHKNILQIGNKSVVDYTLEAVSEFSKSPNNIVILTSDSEVILSYANKYENIKKELRPSHLSNDDSKSVDVVIDLLKKYVPNDNDVSKHSVILLQPTSPLRTHHHIKEAIKSYEESKKESLISGYLDKDGLFNRVYSYSSKEILPLSSDHNIGKPRQHINEVFVRNAAIYIANCEFILDNNRMFSSSPGYYIMDKRSSFDLNDFYDLEVLKCLIK